MSEIICFMPNIAQKGDRLLNFFYQNRQNAFTCVIGKDPTYPPHLHKQVEIFYVLDGEVQLEINNVVQTLEKDDFALIFPNIIHSHYSNSHTTHLLLIFDVELVSDFFNIFTNYYAEFPFFNAQTMHSDCLFCITSFQSQLIQNTDLKLLKGYLTILLSRIFEQLPLIEIKKNIPVSSLQKTLSYLSEHFREPISLHELSKHLGISTYQVSRIFSHKIGVSFNCYLSSLRIQMACHLLVTSTSSITEISYECGFESQRTFYRSFQSLCHMSPKEYRKRNQIL